MRPPRVRPAFRTWTMRDGYILHGRIWLPAAPLSKPPNEIILYLHGIQSHGGWFEWSAAELADTGSSDLRRVVILPDRRGSGLNAPARGDTPAAETWLADLDDVIGAAHREFGPAPVSVVGVSWGGKPAVLWALRRPDWVHRLLLIAPGFFPQVDVSRSVRARIVWSLVTRPHARFEIPLSDPALFTDNPAGREFINNDSIKLTTATARFFYHSRRLDWQLARVPAAALKCDTTLLVAGRERIIRNEPTVAWLTRICAVPPHVHRFDEAAHTLEFEPDCGPLASALRAWSSPSPHASPDRLRS